MLAVPCRSSDCLDQFGWVRFLGGPELSVPGFVQARGGTGTVYERSISSLRLLALVENFFLILSVIALLVAVDLLFVLRMNSTAI
ncbi:hypothetical protein M758_9G049600 [Ceratodon purpureus]|nr:hypothetical protein M758_9G049600 [Ceratodon purpureus]